MVCLIRDISTWAHIAQCDVVDYDIPLFSVENLNGKIKIAGEHPEYKYCWVILDGNIFYGETASPSDGCTELSVNRPMNAFDRTLVYRQTLVYELTSDSSMDPEKRYFEKSEETRYMRVSDETRDPEKTYFLKDGNDAYIHETITAFESGVTYFEKTVEAEYIRTSDAAMIIIKTYYEKSGNVYTPTTDTSFQTGKVYYERVSEATYAQTSDASYNSNKTYYICDYRDCYIRINSTIFEENGVYFVSVPFDRYTETVDTSFISGKQYYELIDNYGGSGDEVLETFIQHEIEDNFINQMDPVYAMPYINVQIVGDPVTVATLNFYPNEVYSFLDVIDLAYEMKLMFGFLLTAEGITIYIYSAVSEENNVFFDDGHNYLDDVTVSDELVARVTVRRVREEEESLEIDEEKDYYWHKDGTISTIPPNPRLKGVWDIVSVDDDEIDLIEAAEEAMAGNGEAVKISFYSDQRFYLWDKITCLVNDEVITETITSCSIAMGDPRYLYTVGEMPTTLTDKFESANGQGSSVIKTSNSSIGQKVTMENRSESYLEKTGGSVNGSVGVQDTTSTDKLIVGPNSYGSSLPSSGKTGQVFFVI